MLARQPTMNHEWRFDEGGCCQISEAQRRSRRQDPQHGLGSHKQCTSHGSGRTGLRANYFPFSFAVDMLPTIIVLNFTWLLEFDNCV